MRSQASWSRRTAKEQAPGPAPHGGRAGGAGDLQRSGLAGPSCCRDGRACDATRIGRGSLRWPTETCGVAASASPGHRLVSLFVAIDVALVALLPGDRALAASYQASAALSRVPLSRRLRWQGCLSIAVTARERGDDGRPGGPDVRGGGRAGRGGPGDCPGPILALVFPAQYSAVATLLRSPL